MVVTRLNLNSKVGWSVTITIFTGGREVVFKNPSSWMYKRILSSFKKISKQIVNPQSRLD